LNVDIPFAEKSWSPSVPLYTIVATVLAMNQIAYSNVHYCKNADSPWMVFVPEQPLLSHGPKFSRNLQNGNPSS
jgi:hypothetical protein